MTWLARNAILLLIGILAAQNNVQQPERQRPLPSEDEPIKLNTTLVQVPVIVREGGGRYLTDLRKEEFTIYENGVKQEVEFFGTVEAPFNVALLLDSSGSTLEQLEQIKAAAFAFVNTLRPQDRVMIVEFNDSVRIACELTGDREQMRRAIATIAPGEYTQVYEAIYTAVWEKLAEVEGRKAVILFSDGIDTASSEIKLEDTLDAVIESEDTIIYPIRYSTRADVERRLERKFAALRSTNPQKAASDHDSAMRELDRSYRRADEYLTELAQTSGGVVERADSITDLDAAFGRIAEELRRQYLLGYYPDKRSEKTRRINVRVSRYGAVVRARPGYKMAQ
jgi:VWFA-related protein